MSEITIDFTLRFAKAETADWLHRGFEMVVSGRRGEARDHFKARQVDLGIDGKRLGWDLESYRRDGKYLAGTMVANPLFKPQPFFKELTGLGAKHLIADYFNNQVGAGQSIAISNGRKSSASAVNRFFAKDNPDFALGPAVWSGKLKEVKALLEQGADPNTKYNGSAVLALAIVEHHTRIAHELLKAGAKGDCTLNSESTSSGWPTFRGESALVSALFEDGALPMAKKLLKAGADINRADDDGNSPLYYLLSPGSLDFAKFLLKNGATVNTPINNDGLTPFLMFLCDANYEADTSSPELKEEELEVFDLLIAHGADVSATCASGGNTRWYARDHDLICQRLVELGAAEPVAPKGVEK